ncbi:MAG: multidrug transporter subunit MdtA, partial [Proteobacteria bacterium]|nr:multidrug transporter subunit MdtA [Pseudomonadota bacterium]
DSASKPAAAPDQQARAATESAANGSAAESAATGRAGALDRLPPELREKVLSLPPEERRAYVQKLREQRSAQKQ